MTLKTEIQSRIDALTYPVDSKILLQNAADTVSQELDLTNIISVLNSSTAAITGSTPVNDITALNATSVALGVTSKESSSGGGSATSVGDLIPLFVDDTDGLHTALSGEEWLKTGVIDTDTSSRPDAKTSTPTDGLGLTVPEIISGDDGTLIGFVNADVADVSTGLNFDGVGQYISILPASLAVGEVLTIRAKADSGNNTDGYRLVGRADSFWSLIEMQTTSINLVFQTGASFSVSTGYTQPPVGTWFVVELIRTDASNYEVRLDTASIGTINTSLDFIPDIIGALNTDEIQFSSFYFAGTIEYVSTSLYYYSFPQIKPPFNGGEYTGTSFDHTSEDTVPRDMTWDGSHYWVVGDTNNKIFQYNSSGIYTGFSFSVSAQTSNPFAITFDGTNLWVLGYSQDRIYEYTLAGIYTGNSIYTGSQDNAMTGVVYHEGSLWVSCFSGSSSDGNEVFQYDISTKAYTGVTKSLSVHGDDVTGLAWDGSHFWAAYYNPAEIYQFTEDWVSTGVGFSASSETTSASGLCWDGLHIFVTEWNNDKSHAYTGYAPYVGIPTAEVDESTGLPIYLKIKE